jgi:cytoplasmic iron level regulating protein YaaA (DUF328/UPF0246 family)
MLILLPPSETKRPGGSGAPIDAPSLALPSLAPQRDAVIDALVALSEDEDAAARVLKLSERQRGDVATNALDAGTLPAVARRWLGAHVLIHSAPFGPVRATDRIPAYRLAAGAAVPGIPPLRRLWADAVSAAVAELAPSFVLDLRSEAYAALGPVPATVPSVYVRVVTAGPDGEVRALNHFNKHAKGDLVRALALARPRVASLTGFVRWAHGAGWTVRPGAAGELELVV